MIAVVDESSCAVAEMAQVAQWYLDSSARQCGACTWGLKDLAGATRAIALGRPGSRLDDIPRWTSMVRGRGACHLPDGKASFLESGIATFAAEVVEHQHGHCNREDHWLLPTPAQDAWP